MQVSFTFILICWTMKSSPIISLKTSKSSNSSDKRFLSHKNWDLGWPFLQAWLLGFMATHSSTPAWKIPWTEEPGGLQSMGLQRVRHDWVTSLSHIGEGNGNPLQCSCLENPRDGEAWWAAIYGVSQSRTRLKWLSSSRRNRQCYWLTVTVKEKIHFVGKYYLLPRA